MKMTALDKDRDDAFSIIKEFVKRIEEQDRQGLKSHLDGH